MTNYGTRLILFKNNKKNLEEYYEEINCEPYMRSIDVNLSSCMATRDEEINYLKILAAKIL